MRILLIGFGHVGRRFAEIVLQRHRYGKLRNFVPSVVGITTANNGSLHNPRGIDLKTALEAIEEGPFSPSEQDFEPIDSARAASELDYDVLVELSTLSIAGRGEPAASYMKTALLRGRHVVTANKGPVAYHGGELCKLAHDRGLAFLFESTVMDGAPLFNLRRHSLLGCEIRGIEGMINSTTSFILTRMGKGETFQQALEQARSQGFVESDPSRDLEGWDAAAKLAILARVLLEVPLTPDEISRRGIETLAPRTVVEAASNGRPFRLIARARKEGSRIRASVAPEQIDRSDLFATLQGPGSALRIETDLMGPIVLVQEAPTVNDTAYGIFNDLLEVEREAL